MSTPAKKPKSSASRVAAYRQRMRAKGLVPKTIWVPNADYAEAFRRAAKAIGEHEAHNREIDAWIEQAYEGHDLGPIPGHHPVEEE